jgi:uncharacterized protein with von Willebrand factor type A (vWA) domain
MRADAARAAFTAFRQDPTHAALNPKDINQLAQQFNRVINAPNQVARVEAAQDILRSAEAMGAQQGSGRHRAEKDPAWALSGTVSPTGAVAQKPAGQQQGTPAGSNTGHNTHRKGGPEQGI